MTAADKKASPTEETKERFRQALEAKKAQTHKTTDSAGAGGVHGPETVGPVGKRQFRRKAGG
jgi:hypothetical protein